MKTLVALIISSILLAPIANADDRCDTCNPGGGSVGDGYVFKPYRCPNDFGRMQDSYESKAGTPVDYKALCPEIELIDDGE